MMRIKLAFEAKIHMTFSGTANVHPMQSDSYQLATNDISGSSELAWHLAQLAQNEIMKPPNNLYQL